MLRCDAPVSMWCHRASAPFRHWSASLACCLDGDDGGWSCSLAATFGYSHVDRSTKMARYRGGKKLSLALLAPDQTSAWVSTPWLIQGSTYNLSMALVFTNCACARHCKHETQSGIHLCHCPWNIECKSVQVLRLCHPISSTPAIDQYIRWKGKKCLALPGAVPR